MSAVKLTGPDRVELTNDELTKLTMRLEKLIPIVKLRYGVDVPNPLSYDWMYQTIAKSPNIASGPKGVELLALLKYLNDSSVMVETT